MNRKILFMIALLASAALTAHAQDNLVTNGGFETGTFSGWTNSGDTSFTAVSNSSFGHTPHSGTYEAHFGPTSSDGFLDQNVPTTPGLFYIMDFWLSNNDTLANNHMSASFAGTTFLTL